MFYDFKTFKYDKESSKWRTKFIPNDYKRPIKLKYDVIDSDNKKVLKKGSKINFVIANKMYEEGLKDIFVSSDFFLGAYVKENLLDPSTNEVFLKSGSPITQENFDKIKELNINVLRIVDVDPINKG